MNKFGTLGLSFAVGALAAVLTVALGPEFGTAASKPIAASEAPPNAPYRSATSFEAFLLPSVPARSEAATRAKKTAEVRVAADKARDLSRSPAVSNTSTSAVATPFKPEDHLHRRRSAYPTPVFVPVF